jgi:DNA-binding CsgD family transcriptional regulator
LLSNNYREEFWGFGNRNIFRFSPNLLNGELELESYPISRDLRTQIGREGFECLVEIEPGTYLIGLSEGYVVFQPSESQPVQHEVYLSSGLLNPDSPDERVLRPGTLESAIEFGKGSIRLDLGVSELNKYQEVFYQYTLNGEQLTPEEWTADPTLFLSSLQSGKHRLVVRSRIGATLSSNELHFDIRVIPPWYARPWAWLVYVALAASIFYTLHILYKKHYKRQSERQERQNLQLREQERLEAEQRIAQIELEKMQQEVDSKNRELGASTLSLIRKNEILNKIKEMLLKIESRKTEPILELIDRNLRDEDEWKSFEEAFNNADKDFLKRIKEMHPELTPHDLRICTYLRLNLSSKEIAPLLNISVKSVEVKRYRLRKKLGLNPKQGLIDYILQL